MSVLNSAHDLCESVLIINEGVALTRVCSLGMFCPRQGRGFKPPAAYLYSNIGRVPPPPPPTPGYPADVIHPRLVFEAAPRPPEVRVEIPFNLIGK